MANFFGKLGVWARILILNYDAIYDCGARKEAYATLFRVYKARRQFDLAEYCHDRYESLCCSVGLEKLLAIKPGKMSDFEVTRHRFL